MMKLTQCPICKSRNISTLKASVHQELLAKTWYVEIVKCHTCSCQVVIHTGQVVPSQTAPAPRMALPDYYKLALGTSRN